MKTDNYKHWNDIRTPRQIELTNHLVCKQSDLNLLELQNKHFQASHRNKDILTIGINGLPYNETQFVGFTFTSKFINYFPPCMEPTGTDEFYMQRLKQISVATIVKQIDEIVRANGDRVLLVYHSYGSFIASHYCHEHPNKVVGIVEFGPFPITATPRIRLNAPLFESRTRQDYMKNLDKYYQEYVEFMSKIKTSFRPLTNKYMLAAHDLLFMETLSYMNQRRRNLPKVLKLIIIGRSDKVIQPVLLNQLIAYHSYGNSGRSFLSPQYQQPLSKSYEAITGIKTTNLQEKFVFSLYKTGHGVHMARKAECQRLMNLYLAVLLHKWPEKSKL